MDNGARIRNQTKSADSQSVNTGQRSANVSTLERKLNRFFAKINKDPTINLLKGHRTRDQARRASAINMGKVIRTWR